MSSEEGSEGSASNEESEEPSQSGSDEELEGEDEEEVPRGSLKGPSIQETVDTLQELSRRMDTTRARLQNQFPRMKAPEKKTAKVAQPPPAPPSEATPRLTLLDPYRHSVGGVDDALGGDWATAPHVAAALRTLLLDQDDARAAAESEHERLLRSQQQPGL